MLLLLHVAILVVASNDTNLLHKSLSKPQMSWKVTTINKRLISFVLVRGRHRDFLRAYSFQILKGVLDNNKFGKHPLGKPEPVSKANFRRTCSTCFGERIWLDSLWLILGFAYLEGRSIWTLEHAIHFANHSRPPKSQIRKERLSIVFP